MIAFNRRNFMAQGAAALAWPLTAASSSAEEIGRSRLTAYAFTFKALGTGDIRLVDFAGKPVVVVNTASLCGFTPQYAGLQTLFERYRERGLMIVGVPSNDFGGQEPGNEDEIDHTAHGRFGVTFPMAAKAVVKGPDQHPFYRWAARERPLELPRWNFHKYLVGKGGHLAASFDSRVEPLDPRMIRAIDTELGPAG